MVRLNWQLAGTWDGNGRSDCSSAAVIETLVPPSQLRLQIMGKSLVPRNIYLECVLDNDCAGLPLAFHIARTSSLVFVVS